MSSTCSSLPVRRREGKRLLKVRHRGSTAWRWVLLAGFVAAIYAFLPFGRGVVIALRQSHLLGLVVTLVFFASFVGLVYHIVFNVRLSDRVAFVALVVLAAATGALVLWMSIPEERIHFVEYGLLALLARSVLARHLPPSGQYLGAWLLASLAGWGDELIQGALPDRVYDLRDVVVNSVAALLALAGDEALHNRVGWRGREGEIDGDHPDRRG